MIFSSYIILCSLLYITLEVSILLLNYNNFLFSCLWGNGYGHSDLSSNPE